MMSKNKAEATALTFLLSFLIVFTFINVVDSSSYWNSIVDGIKRRSTTVSSSRSTRSSLGEERRGGSSSTSTSDVASSSYEGKKQQDGASSSSSSRDDLVPIYPIDTTAVEKRGGLKSLASTSTFATSTVSNRMPSLFLQPNEQYLDRYSACLAATEGLRKLRDTAAIEASRKRKKFRGVKSLICGPIPCHGNDPDYEEAYAEYIQNSSKVIRALGLSVAQFNQIGKKVSADPLLKEKVLEQAYLYRMTATLNMDKVPMLQNASSEKRLNYATERQKLQMFVKSMSEIEELRLEQLERLQNALHLKELPSGFRISDPRILPLLNPKIRAIVEAFPHQAKDIVQKYGLKGEEFNQMLEETQHNPMFRWKVKSQLRKQQQDEAKRTLSSGNGDDNTDTSMGTEDVI